MLDQIRSFIVKAQAYAKAIVAGAGTVLVAVAGLSDQLGITIIPVEAAPWVTFALTVLTAFATWAVPNVPLEGKFVIGVDGGFVRDDEGFNS